MRKSANVFNVTLRYVDVRRQQISLPHIADSVPAHVAVARALAACYIFCSYKGRSNSVNRGSIAAVLDSTLAQVEAVVRERDLEGSHVKGAALFIGDAVFEKRIFYFDLHLLVGRAHRGAIFFGFDVLENAIIDFNFVVVKFHFLVEEFTEMSV